MNIAVVGAGTGGTRVVRSLSGLDSVNVNMVVDRNMDAPGIKLARELGIRCSGNIDDINPEDTDIIIEVTGNENVSRSIHERYNDKCRIIDSEGALLIIELVSRDAVTLEKLNSQMSAIGRATAVVSSQLKSISGSVEDIYGVTERLIDFTNVSNEYINESDEIVQYVNNIAQQTKILGINATIEAARAGEHGRTFAVVAKEIQNLANDSEVYAKDINNILQKLSYEIKKLNEEVNSLKKLSQMQIEASNAVNSAMESLINEAGN